MLVRCLEAHGTRRLYCVPGESYLAVLDALHDHPMDVITCRHESGAAMMAEAEGKLTGQPGVCFVTRGPGATNATAGVHIAHQDSTPMILFIGQVARGDREREAFQEIDYKLFLGPLTKWTAEIDDPRRIPEMVSRAYQVATAGRPGPVALSLPEDMLREEVRAVVRPRPYRPVRPRPSVPDMTDMVNHLRVAERPLVLIGGRPWQRESFTLMRDRLEAWGMPVATAFRYADSFDHASKVYVGDMGLGANPGLVEGLTEADLVLAIGVRLGEATTGGYTRLSVPRPHQTLIHVYPGAEELGRVYQPDLAILAEVNAFAEVMPVPPPQAALRYQPWLAKLRESYRSWTKPVPNPGPVQMADVVSTLRAHLPPEAIITNGAGNYGLWQARFGAWTRPGTQLAPTSGSMGYGLPAAIAAALTRPGAPVLCWAGDGCFLMTGQELATAVARKLRLLIIVVDNGMYGTIRAHQERDYPGRVSASDLVNPDFAALATSYGALGLSVETTEAFAPALEQALAHEAGPVVIHLKLVQDALSPSSTITGLRAKAEASKGTDGAPEKARQRPAGEPMTPVKEPAAREPDPQADGRKRFSIFSRPKS